MLRILSRLQSAALYPAALTIITAQSEIARFKAIGKTPVVHFDAPYDGQKIMLLALYQKGKVRPDVIRLLQAAKDAGLYVLAVNTLKLKDPKTLNGLVDCYIERPNFGRDFGSYKTGFLHLFNRGWAEKCSRLLMINDSIFHSDARMPKFLDDMMSSEVEALGSTENYEIEYHLGSFCIAMAGTILRNPQFHTYWHKYRLSDVRPRVIVRGEMKLSKTLKRCVSSPDQFVALYGASRFFAEVKQDSSLLDFAIANGRTSELTHWKRVNPKSVLAFLKARFMIPVNGTGDSEIVVETTLKDLNDNAYVVGYEDLMRYLKRQISDGSVVDEDMIGAVVAAYLTEVFMEGSQIHQNCSTLIRMGLPIVKLDGLYRGMFNLYDIGHISSQLLDHESEELNRLLMERPFGGDTLIGWKKAAFVRGLI